MIPEQASIRSTISALPTTNPRRQPAIPYDFDIENISTPTFFALGCEEALRLSSVEHEVAVREVVDDDGARRARVADSGIEEPGGAVTATGFEGS